MRIAAAILTWNMYRTGRDGLFAATRASLVAGVPDALTVVTAGSTDGTAETVRNLGGIVDDTRSDIWYGMSLAIDWCLAQEPDLVLFSNDDVRYVPGWRSRLESLWWAAPENLKLVGLILEPAWRWNQVYDARTIGGERVLFRESAPATAWSFRAYDWQAIGPLPEQSPGEDLNLCRRMRGNGYDIGQVELATHEGMYRSTWGNRAWTIAQPLDRARWGLAPRRARGRVRA